MKKPTVSVIIPTYNRAKFLPRTINSVLNQTFKDFELIIVDDCSSDNTKEVVEEFLKKDERIKYIRLEKNSGGAAHPRNVGIQNSQGEYIAFLDDDDEWLPDKLEKQLELFKNSDKKNLGFVSCNALIVEENGKIKEYKIPKYENVFEMLLYGNFIGSPSGVMVKKDVFNKIDLFDKNLVLYEDLDMWLRLVEKYDFDFVDMVLFKYYVHKYSILRSFAFEKWIKDSEYFLAKYIEYYKKYLKAESIFKRKLASICCACGEMKKGRKYYLESIKLNPLNLKLYFYLILSFCGAKIFRKLYFLRLKFN